MRTPRSQTQGPEPCPGDVVGTGDHQVVVPCDVDAVPDESFIASLVPISDDLCKAHDSVLRGDVPTARHNVVIHFFTRPTPVYHFDHREGQASKLYLTIELQGLNDDCITAVADDMLQHRFHTLFYPDDVLSMGTPIDWTVGKNSDVTGIETSMARTHFLMPLMLAYLATHQEKYAAKFEELFRIYHGHEPMIVRGNPAPHDNMRFSGDGRQHNCMNVGFRVMNYLDCLYSGLFTTPRLSVDFCFYFIKKIWFHAMQFHRMRGKKEMFEQQNHHHFEFRVLPFLIGVMFPEWAAARSLRDYGAQIIQEHARRELFEDGVPVEHSAAYMARIFWYHGCSMDLARKNHINLLPHDQEQRLRRYGELVLHLRQPNGMQTSFGDVQMHAAWIDALHAVTFFPAASACNALTAIGFDAARVPAGAGASCFRPELFTGNRGPTLPPTMAVYREGGLALMRSHWGGDASFVFLSMNSKSIASHDHAEPLSLNLAVRGQSLISVPTDGLYGHIPINTDERWRYMYGMRSHNSVVIDGGLVAPIQTWSAGAPKCRLINAQPGRDTDVVEAEYQIRGITHRRRLEFRKSSALNVIDRFTGIPATESHTYHLLYHLDWGIDLVDHEDRFVLSALGIICMLGFVGPHRLRYKRFRDEACEGDCQRQAAAMGPGGESHKQRRHDGTVDFPLGIVKTWACSKQ